MAESQFSIEKEILSIRWNGGRMSRKIIWIAITVIAVVAGSILLYNMFYRERESQAAVEEFEEYTGTHYKISDNYSLPGHRSMNEIAREEGVMDKADELCDALNGSEYFTYYEVYDKLLQYEGNYDMGYAFLHVPRGLTEEEMDDVIHQKALSGEEIILLTNIKGMFIGEKAFDQLLSLRDHITEGKGFEPEDFIFDDVVNVVLGSEYKEFYDIGDRIVVHYICEPIELNVIGFLDDSAAVDIGNIHVNLSTFIVVPSFKIVSQEKKGQYFNVAHSLFRASGIIEINDNVDIKTALSACDDMFSKSGLDYWYFQLGG